MGQATPDMKMVDGTMSAAERDRKPIGWMLLNECREPGRLNYAYRTIPGIVLPSNPTDKEMTVLKLISIANEREEDIPEGTLIGSGLVAVRFVMNISDVDLSRRTNEMKNANDK